MVMPKMQLNWTNLPEILQKHATLWSKAQSEVSFGYLNFVARSWLWAYVELTIEPVFTDRRIKNMTPCKNILQVS